MAFKGVTCAGQNVTPKNDRGLIQSHFGDGILWGCGMSVSSDDLVVALGEIVAGGTIVFVDGSTNVDLSGRQIDTGYIQVILNVDLTKPEGEQIYTTYDESASISGFSALTKDDIWATGTLYQLRLAIVQIAGGNLSLYSSVSDSVDLYSASGSRRAMNLYENNVLVGRLRNNAVTGYTEVGTVNSDGTLKAGLRASNATQVEVFANNGTIKLCPKGANDTTNDVEIDTDGQIHGGHNTKPDVTKSTQSLTANTWTSLGSVTLEVGTWLIMGTASFKCLGTTSNDWGMINIGHSNSATACRQAMPLRGSTSAYLSANAFLIIEVTTANYTIDLYANASANTTVQNAMLRAVQLA